VKVVIDPNVLISAVITSGVSAMLLDRWLTDRPFDVVVCPALVGELRAVLARERFRRWISVPESEIFVMRLEEEAEQWADPADVPAMTGDPKDDYLVALYLDCGADLLVSGDSDLLDLQAEDVDVLTPGDLLARL
jgi:uncharacterized protein